MNTWSIWFDFAATLIIGGLAVTAWRHRFAPGALPFMVFTLAQSQWSIGILFCIGGTTVAVKLAWMYFYMGAAYICLLSWVAMALQMSGAAREFSRKTLVGTALGITALYLLAVSNWQGWFLAEIRVAGNQLQGRRGPFYWLTLGSLYGLFLWGVILFIRQYGRSCGLRRRRAGLMLVSIVPMLLLNLVNVYCIQRYHRSLPEPFPIFFAITDLIMAWGIFRWRFFDIMPVAQAVVAEKMGDSLIILDTQDDIVALNPAAQRLLGKDPEALVGAKLREVFDFWPSLCQAVSDGTLKTVEERCELGGMRHFQIHLTPLRDPRQRPLGKVILLHDMTEQKQAAARLLEQQKALAILTERDRISRELHDGQGQIWGYFNMQLEAARSLIARNNAAGAAELLAQLAGVVRTVHAGIRESIDGLQTAAAAAGDLLQRLSEYLDWFGRNYGIRTELAVAGESLAGKLSPVTEAQLLRIVQEALANAKKHANPSRILVTVAGGAGRATITVEDDGCGFEPDPGQRNRRSYGLKIMRERAEDIGGELRVESAVGSGTRVTVSVRLE